ncbi:MAG: hypothetical protein K6G31_06915 [Paludibacteraceae bacterium]|nr:hypothetical protein [Paludibacteraceae bacterium]
MNKRIFIISLVLAFSSLAGYAKKKGNEASVVDSYTFYGVNYSKCHTYGWGENPEQTISALAEISRLFVSEMSKYDLQKFLEKRVDNYDVEVSVKQTLAKDPKTLETYNQDDRLSFDTIQAVVRGLELKDSTGYGLMIFGDFLNKKDKVGIYQYVFFDIATREIVEKWEAEGEPGGFGLRNYWAKSVYNTLRTPRFTKLYYKVRTLPARIQK